MVLGYLALVEAGKRIFYRTAHVPHQRGSKPSASRHLRRRTARFSTGEGT
jgi:Mg2+-importing ATPase